jgi:tetratricopeptide (TPR) repeat protein
MRADRLSFFLLAAVAFTLGTILEPWFQGWQGNRAGSTDVLQVALGDSRKLFARHVYLKADAYFHNGYYPTIYDNRAGYQKSHIQQTAGAGSHPAEDQAEENFLGKSKDWIDEFSRHFFPSRHTHLGEADAPEDSENQGEPGKTGGADHGHAAPEGVEREILPWLQISAELDPQRTETYVVASFWLRTKLNKVDKAEQFLRDGLRANPGDSEILFELGRIYFENRHDPARARNVWELAAKNWHEREEHKPEPTILVYAEILNHLALLEREQGNYGLAIEHYTALKAVSPYKESVQGWIDFLKTNAPPRR